MANTANELAASIIRARGHKSSEGKYVARMTPKQQAFLLSLAERDQQRTNTPLQGDHARGQTYMNLTGNDQEWGDAPNPMCAWHSAGLNLWAQVVLAEPEPAPEKPKGPTRERETGRYTHEWGCIGFNENRGYQIDRCEDCGRVRVSDQKRLFRSVEDAADHGITGFLEGYGPALDSPGPKSDSSPTPPTEASTKGATRMAITDRNLEPGTKLVAKYKGETYHAEVVRVEQDGNEVTRYRMTLNGEAKDYKTPSAAGSAIFGVDSNGKPRTCNGWGFWSIDTGEAPQDATTKPTGRTRRKKDAEATTEAHVDPHAGLPIIERVEGDFECGECGQVDADRGAVAAHIRASHAGYNNEAAALETERELATA